MTSGLYQKPRSMIPNIKLHNGVEIPLIGQGTYPMAGNTLYNALKNALDCAKISPKEVGYINAHGTATLQGDVAESLATEKVFKGCNTPISTIKSYTGHTLGACGAIEAILSIEMMNRGWFCPTLNLENPDENCGKLNYIKDKGVELRPEIIMSNNFAFGGINTSLIFRKI